MITLDKTVLLAAIKKVMPGVELSKKFHALANQRLRELTGPFKLYGDIGQP